MLRRTNPGKILTLIVLVFGFSLSVNAQRDCSYGFRIYVRDEAGKTIENAKHEVSGVSQKDKLPAAFQVYFTEGAYFAGAIMRGPTIRGNFLLRVSAAGFETYERQVNFPVCEIQSYELRMRPEGSTRQALFERLFTVHGKVFDEDKKPFGNAKVEARSADGRVYQTTSNAYGYYKIDLPKGTMSIRISDARIPDVVFDNYKIEKNYSVLNAAVCLKCNHNQSKN
jgi:Carboxypeptidase regulatory-like domain